jgi:hypothetical protein
MMKYMKMGVLLGIVLPRERSTPWLQRKGNAPYMIEGGQSHYEAWDLPLVCDLARELWHSALWH